MNADFALKSESLRQIISCIKREINDGNLSEGIGETDNYPAK
ncbi:hypothetical protein Metlim_0543 [Methanoplanus limicola DSM 2279]|uniref:Uncharacterized protein n=1 Tax=Methanoplanus limicola DSM 2279 TaxID=937775 RepID=H1Z2T9_9EURY|nr:hypothetical protein Metlim_0543 [Methanoplanus limicola DSM 2279]